MRVLVAYPIMSFKWVIVASLLHQLVGGSSLLHFEKHGKILSWLKQPIFYLRKEVLSIGLFTTELMELH